jgi:hypothetical protein
MGTHIRQIFLTATFTLFDNRMTIATPRLGAQYKNGREVREYNP